MKRFLVGLMMSALFVSCMPEDVSKYKKCGLGIKLEDTNASCDYAERDLKDVHVYLTVVGLDSDAPDTVIFRATQDFLYPDGRYGSGFTSLGWLETDFSASSLAHEMLHQREGQKLMVGTTWHEGWSSKGFNGLDMFWSWIVTQNVLTPVDGSFCSWYQDLRPDHAKLLKAAGYPVDEWRWVRARARASEKCMAEITL